MFSVKIIDPAIRICAAASRRIQIRYGKHFSTSSPQQFAISSSSDENLSHNQPARNVKSSVDVSAHADPLQSVETDGHVHPAHGPSPIEKAHHFITIKMPALWMFGDPSATARLLVWRKNVGDLIKTSDILCDIETESAVFSYAAQTGEEGELAEILVPGGKENISSGHPIAKLIKSSPHLSNKSRLPPDQADAVEKPRADSEVDVSQQQLNNHDIPSQNDVNSESSAPPSSSSKPL